MFIEKKLKTVPARLLTANGSAYGLIQVADTRGFYVKQKIILKASNIANDLTLEIKRFESLNSFYVGDPGKGIGDRFDVSAYLTAQNATIEASEQPRPGVSRDDADRAVYMEEPIVALRVYNVDEHGDSYNTQNPVPVRLTDGSVNIGSVNANLDVQLSAKDNYPALGDVHDSVRIGDQNNELKVNADGSINVNNSSSSAELLAPQIINLSLTAANTGYSLALPNHTKKFTIKLRDGMGPMKVFYNTGDFFTVSRGASYSSGDVNLPATSLTVQSSQAMSVLEAFCWVVTP